MEKPKWTFWSTQYFFFFPSRWIECLPCASHWVRQNSNSIQLFLVLRFNLFIRWLLIPTVIIIQGMDVRYSATFPVGDGHLPPGQWTKPFLDSTGRILLLSGSLRLGTLFLEELSARCPGILPCLFSTAPAFLGPTFSFTVEGGTGVLARTPVAPDTVGAPCSQRLKQSATDSMLLMTGDVLLSRGLSIRPHPEKWSPWVQCKSPFPGHRGPGKPKGRRDPSIPAALGVWPGSLQWATPLSASSTRSEHPVLGKEARWGKASHQGY